VNQTECNSYRKVSSPLGLAVGKKGTPERNPGRATIATPAAQQHYPVILCRLST